jgi:phosphonopyruvate decarboxylase
VIQAEDFIGPASSLGFNTWAGVPCSFLTPFIDSVINAPEMLYIASANEGDAVASASGAALAGRPAVAMMQNSGLGNAVSPLSSLNWVFRIPIMLIVTLRGEPGLPDEPQHELMGRITAGMLEQLQIPWAWFPRDTAEVEGALTLACRHMEQTSRPYAFIMRKGSVAPCAAAAYRPADHPPTPYGGALLPPGAAELSRRQALEIVVANTSEADSIVIGSTGYTGRELFAVADRPNQLYMVGSMGCASSFGLGVALALPQRRVVVLDGDGAALMRMGNLATIGAYGGENFRHLVLDNGMHESTGGQHTVSGTVSFAAVAAACGYAAASEAVTGDALQAFLRQATGPALLQLRMRGGVAAALPRPTLEPAAVRQRLQRHLGISTSWQ